MESIAKHQILEFHSDTLVSVRNYYNLDQSRMLESVNILKEWVQKQPHIIKKDFSLNYLEITIICCKGSIEKAKRQIDKMCTFKTLLPKFFTKCDIKTDLAYIAQNTYVLPLPKLTKDHLRIYVGKIDTTEFTSANIMEYYRFNISMCEYLKANDYINGFVIVQDLLKIDLADMIAKINFVELQQLVTILTEGYGSRMLGIHIISESKVVDLFIKALNRFLSPKISSRIHVHNTFEKLHTILDKDILPVEYGGKERSMAKLRDDWIAALSSDEHKDYMKYMLAARTDESLRLTDKFNEECLSMPGSFRNLNVD